MARPAGVRNVLYGTIGGTQTWSSGLYFAQSGSAPIPPPTQAALNTYAEAVWTSYKAQAIKASPGILSLCGTNVVFLGVRSYWYPGPGQAFVKAQSSSASAVGTNTNLHPNQIAVCVSILTDTLGRAYRGRMYLPINALTIDPAGTFSAGQAAAISTAMGNAISALNLINLGSADMTAYIAGDAGGSNSKQVTGVRCDNVCDTIRARRDKVVATSQPYTSVVVG